MDLRRKSMISSMHRLKKSTTHNMMRQIRRAKISDIDQITPLASIQTKKLFGDVKIDNLIVKAFITLVLEKEDNYIAACLSVNNYPNVPSVPPWSWTPWLQNLYQLHDCTPRNTLWVHLALFDHQHTDVFLLPMLKALFAKCVYLQFVFFIVPPKVKFIEWLQPHGTLIMPTGYSDPSVVQVLYMMLRQDFTISYKIRRAVVEDNDDLVPLIDSHSKRLKKIYGEYYVAELITMHRDSGRHLIVAEYGGYAVAVICLNNYVNYSVMNEAFKLEPFNGLKKHDKRDLEKLPEADHLTYKEAMLASRYTIDPSIDQSMSPLFEEEEHREEEEEEEEEEVYEDEEEEEDVDAIDDVDLYSTASSDVYTLDFDVFVEPVKEYESERDASGEGEDLYEEKDETPNFIGHVESLISCLVLSFAEQDLEKWKNNSRISCSEPPGQSKSRLPVYHGEENAFAVEIAVAQPEHEAALIQLLEASFELFPEKEYCLMTVPSTVIAFPLISRIFIRVIPRPSSTFPHELYVLHRSAIARDLEVRPAEKCDIANAEQLMPNSKKSQSVISLFKTSVKFKDSPARSYVVLCNNQMVGLAILSDQEDVAYLNSHYQVSEWTDLTKHGIGSHGCIEYFILSPIFQREIRFLLLEMHRYSDYSIFYYKVHPKDIKWSTSKNLANVLSELLPVVPAKMLEYPLVESREWTLPEVVERVEMPHALYVTTAMHCGLTRWGINARIVVVGASDVGLSFLVALLLRNDPDFRATFNNVTLVSPHGICRCNTSIVREMMLPTTSKFRGYFLALISLRTYVNVVNGVMSSIDRKNKTITVNSTQLAYDFLFLMCGHQYQMPQRNSDLRKGKFEYPQNCFVINTELDADTTLNKLKDILAEHTHGSVIVYGYSLEAFCCLAAMLELGVSPAHLIYIEPRVTNDGYSARMTFNDPDIEESLFSYMRQEGIKIYSGYKFIDWTFDKNNIRVENVKFESQYKIVELDCMAIFFYGEKGISPRTYTAINTAGLIYDGALVITPDCRTNDPNIYAAGTMTKYPRRYYADHMAHKYFNRTEIGEKLAEQIFHMLTPKKNNRESESAMPRCVKKDKMLVPRYLEPLVVYASLPGKLNYMYVHKPGQQAPLEIAMAGDDYGQVLTSGDPKNVDEQGYFRLHLNEYNTVETITCLAKFEMERVNLTCLWGKHERLLNNLVKRFEMVLIEDLFAYFKQPWCFALYHDRFNKLNEDMQDVLMSQTETEGDSLIEDLLSTFNKNNWKTLTKAQVSDIREKFDDSEYHRILEKKFLEFLTENLIFLPMYAHPVVISMILGAFQDSPLFSDL